MKPDHVRRLLIFVGVGAALPGLAQPTSPLAQGEAVLRVVTRAQVRQYSTRDFGRDKYPSGRSVVVPESQAESLLARVRAKLPKGLVAYVGVTNDLSHTAQKGMVELAIAPGSDQFDILRAAATDAANYDVSTEAIITELQKWDREFGIDIWQAETDTIQLRFRSLPKDPMSFAKRVYEFCPDIVDQGTGSVTKLAVAINADKAMMLWWD